MSSIVPGGAPHSKSVYSGRRVNTKSHDAVVPSRSSSRQASAPKPRLKKNTATVEDIDRLLESDALALMNMKKELEDSQKSEILKSQSFLRNLQKEFDALKIENDTKTKELINYRDKYNTLICLDNADAIVSGQTRNTIAEMNAELETVTENIEADQRTAKILNLIAERMGKEISTLQLDVNNLSFQLENAKSEAKASEVSLRLSRHEYDEKEKQFEGLMKTVKERRTMRKEKLAQIHSMVMEGENSVAKIHSTMIEGSQLSSITRMKPFTQIGSSPTNRSSRGTSRQQKMATTSRKTTSQNPMGSEALSANAMGTVQIADVIERFNSREQRQQKLEAVEEEQRQRLEAMKLRYQSFLHNFHTLQW